MLFCMADYVNVLDICSSAIGVVFNHYMFAHCGVSRLVVFPDIGLFLEIPSHFTLGFINLTLYRVSHRIASLHIIYSISRVRSHVSVHHYSF